MNVFCVSIFLNEFDLISFLQKPTDEISIVESTNTQNESTAEQSTKYQTANESTDLDEFYKQPCQSEIPCHSDTEENEVHYIVCLEPTNIDMMLVVSDVSMREKDVDNGR